MPTYQYRCSSCGHEFEEFQSITEDPIERCPRCGKKTHRIISGGAGFLFKGSGFYITDYRSKEYKDKAKKESPSTASGAGDSSAKGGKSADGAAGASSKPSEK
jgi:putative FmdB family regulatory protein